MREKKIGSIPKRSRLTTLSSWTILDSATGLRSGMPSVGDVESYREFSVGASKDL